MDLADLDLVKIADQGAFCQFAHPTTGALLFAEDETGKADESKPIGCIVYGADSTKYRDAVKRFGNHQMKNKKQLKMDELELANIELVALSIGEFRNFTWKKEKITNPPEEKKIEILKQPWIREQIVAFRDERSNFLAE